MKETRSSESRKLRQDLARLLLRLRAIRRDVTVETDRAARIRRELSEAGGAGSFVAFRGGNGPDAVPFVDHQKLRGAEGSREVTVSLGGLADRCA
jgi:hypothetical protein